MGSALVVDHAQGEEQTVSNRLRALVKISSQAQQMHACFVPRSHPIALT